MASACDPRTDTHLGSFRFWLLIRADSGCRETIGDLHSGQPNVAVLVMGSQSSTAILVELFFLVKSLGQTVDYFDGLGRVAGFY